MMTAEILKARTKQFAIRVVKMCRALPRSEEARIIRQQVLRSATSVAANYRAGCRARSRAEFVAKNGIVVEEIDETAFWLELLVDLELASAGRMEALMREGNELLDYGGFTSHSEDCRCRQMNQ